MNINERLRPIIREMMDCGISVDVATKRFKREYVLLALEISEGNVSGAARALGINRNTVHNLIRTLAIANAARPTKEPL